MLSTEDKKWLINVTGMAIDLQGDAGTESDPKALALVRRKLKNQDQDELDESRKQKLIDEVMALIEPLLDKIDAATDLTQSVKNDEGKMEDRRAKDQNLANAMETTRGGTISNASGKSGSEAGILASQAQTLIDLSRQRLQGEMTDRWVVTKDNTVEKGEQVRLFTDDEIMSALYDPMLRSGDISDSLVSDSMSRNQQMIDKTNDLYKKDLTDPGKDPPTFGFLGLMESGVDLAGNISGVILESAGVMSKDQVSTLLAGSTEAAKLLLDVGDTMMDAKAKGVSFDAVQKLLDRLPAIVGGFVGGFTDKDFAKLVQDAVTAGTKLPKVVQTVCEGSLEDTIKSAGTLLSSITTAVVDGITREIKQETAPKQGDSSDEKDRKKTEQTNELNQWALNGDLAGMATKLVTGTAPKLVSAIRSGKASSVKAVLFQFADDLSGTLAQVVIDKQKTDTALGQQERTASHKDLGGSEGDQRRQEDTQKTNSENDQLTQEKLGTDIGGKLVHDVVAMKSGFDGTVGVGTTAQNTMGGAPEKLVTERQQKMDDARKQYLEEVANDVYEELKEQGEKERKALGEALRGGGEVTDESLGKIIAAMQRDKALIGLLIAVANAGIAVAAKLLPALGVASDAVKLYANLQKAVENYDYMTKFKEQHESALGSYSRFGPAIENFLNNQEFQFTRNSVAAAASGLKVIANAIATAMPIAAPAKTGLDIVASGVDMAFQYKQSKKLAKAWKETKKSFQNPKDRALAQKVRSMNPTLAKYVIAYGVEERDPVARSMAEDCGLTEATMNDPTANLSNVKKFFEMTFADDPTLVGYWDDGKSAWKKKVPTPEVTRAALMKTYAAMREGFKNAENELAVPPSLLGSVNFLESQPIPKAIPQEKDEREKLKLALEQRIAIAEKLEAGVTEEGTRVAKAVNDNSVRDVFSAFADAASDVGFAAFLRVAELAKAG